MSFVTKNILLLLLVLTPFFAVSCAEDPVIGPSVDENLISREVSYFFIQDGSVSRLAEAVTVHNRVNVVFQVNVTRFSSIVMPLEVSATRSGTYIYAVASYESGSDSLFKINVGENIPIIELRTQLPLSGHNSVKFFENIGGFVVFADTAVKFDGNSLEFSQGVSFGSQGVLLAHAKGDTILAVSNDRIEGYSAITKLRNVSVALPSPMEWFDIADSGSVVYLAGFELGSAENLGARLFRVDLLTGEASEMEVENVYGIDSDNKGNLFIMRSTAEGNTLISRGLSGEQEELVGSPLGLEVGRNNLYSYTAADGFNFSVFLVDDLARSVSVELLGETVVFIR